MTALTTVEETGGSPIVSYGLEWDGGQEGSNTFETLVGDEINNIQLTYVKTDLTSGVVYNFRYRAKNIYGWSPYSNVLSQVAARVPDEPLAPVTSNTATSVTITWQEPYDGATAITGYKVQILTSVADVYELEKTYCNAEFDGTVIDSKTCSIPMSVFTAEPFNLEQGDEVVAVITAIN